MDFKNRKQLRLNNYDYSNNGAYFITVCTQGRRNILSRIIVGEGFHPLPVIELSEIGKEIEKTIAAVQAEKDTTKKRDLAITTYFPNVIPQ